MDSVRNLIILIGIVAFCIGGSFVGGYYFGRHREVGDLDATAEEYRKHADAAGAYAEALERGNHELRERLGDVILTVGRAGRLCEQALAGAKAPAGDIREAIRISEELTRFLESLQDTFSSIAAIDSGGWDVPGIQDGEVIER